MSEYERLRPKNSTRSRRRWLTLLAYGLASFVGTCLLINLTITRQLWRPDLGGYSQSLTQIAAYADEVDTVFLGSSHFAWGINPPVFDEAMAGSGGHATSHLLSTAGLSYPWTAQALTDLEAIEFAGLRFVIIEPRLYVTPVRRRKTDIFGNVFSQRSRFINNVGNISEPLSMLTAMQLPLVQKLPLYAELSYGAIASASNIGVMRDFFLPGPTRSGQTVVTWANRGGEGGKKTISDKGFVQAIDMDQGRREISAYEQQALAQLVARVEAMGATPLFLLPPSRMDTGLQSATRDTLLTLIRPEQLLDYTYPADSSVADINVYEQQDLWLDPEHLNITGAALFSEQLARAWAATFRSTPPVN